RCALPIKPLGAPRERGNEKMGGSESDGGSPAEPCDPDEAHPRQKEKRSPDERDQHGLPEIRLQHQACKSSREEEERERVRRHFRPARRFAEQPRDQNDKGGFEEF